MSSPNPENQRGPSPPRISGAGETADLIRAKDWSQTPLGPMSSWSDALVTSVNLTLACPFPCVLFWGPEMVQFYNEAYKPLMAGKTPKALGQLAHECWAEIWDLIGPQLDAVMLRGESVYFENVLIPVLRNGVMEDVYWTYSYSPIYGPDGAVEGIFVVSPDTTGEVLAKRQLAEEKAEASRILHSIGDAVIVTDAETRVTRMNPVAEQLTGWPFADAKGRPLGEVFHIVNESTRAIVESPADKVKRLGTIVGLANHTTLIARGGEETHIDDAAAPIRDEDGQLSGIVLVFRDINERRATEQARDALTARLDQVMGVTSDSILSIDREWRITYMNPPARLAAAPLGDILGKNYWESFPGSKYDGSPYVKHYNRAMDEGSAGEFLAFYPEPLNVWIQVNVRPTPDGIVLFFRDVTEQRNLTDALQANEERLRLALSAANGVGIWDWDVVNDLVYADRGFASLYGVDPGHAERGITINEFTRNMHPDDAQRVGLEIASALQTGAEFRSEYRLVQPDGSDRWVSAVGRASLDAEGMPVRFPGVTVDITPRKQAEEALRASEARLRIAAETASLGTWELDVSTWQLECSAICKTNYGRSPDEPFTYDELLASLHPDDRVTLLADLRDAMTHRTPLRIEYRITWPDGAPHWMIVSGRCLYDGNGTPLRFIGVSMNVTERHLATDALMQTEKLAAVGRLAASIAHEINNPLESVTNLLYLARTSTDAAEVQHYLDIAERELRRVSVISNQTLRFHKQSTNPQPIACEELIGSVLSIHQGRVLNSGVSVEKRMRATQPVVCFEGEIRQVLTNLIGNAIDAMHPAGGRLLLRSRETTHWPTGQRGITITVADTGTGMSAQTAMRVFDPFFTTKGIGGTGLGLWVSKEIIMRHQGALRLRSSQAPGHHGTVFTMFLPFAAATR